MTGETSATLALRTARTLDSRDLRLRGPWVDFDGYWLFAPLRRGTDFRALKMGFSVGHYEGSDFALDGRGDPNKVRCTLELIGERDRITFKKTGLTRAQVASAPDGLDIRVGALARIRGAWPTLDFEMRHPEEGIAVDVQLAGRHVHWWPDMVLPGTTFRQYVVPDAAVTGSITIRDRTYGISGLGAFDRPFGRLVASPTSAGLGHSHYDVIMWDERFITVSWLVSDREGRPHIAYGMGTGSGALLLFERFEVEYLEFEEHAKGKRIPRRWRGVLSGEAGTLTYSAAAVGYDADAALAAEPTANHLLTCDGTFTGRQGKTVVLAGVGFPEYHVAYWDPLRPSPPARPRHGRQVDVSEGGDA